MVNERAVKEHAVKQHVSKEHAPKISALEEHSIINEVSSSSENEKKMSVQMNMQETPNEQQPEVSIGMVGHVDHGKTTLVKALSGKWTDTHSEEIKRGITIRLGYADFSIYRCESCSSTDVGWSITEICPKCKKKAVLVRRASLVDAPGHESLMATMLCGANIMDGALLLIAANEECPQPQTKEHVTALEIIGLKNVIVVQNKIDLVDDVRAKKNHDEIVAFLEKTPFANAPIIPVAGLHGMNIDVLLDAIQSRIPTPLRNSNSAPLMFVARSFDVNKPGTLPDNLTGGVLGGALREGELHVGDEVEIVPGYMVEEKNQKVWKSFRSTITSLMSGGNKTDTVRQGGTVAVQTLLDPSVVKSDQLVGSILGKKGKLPRVWTTLVFEPHLLERVVGAKDTLIVEQIKLGELLMLNVNSAATVGIVKELGKNKIICELRKPVAADKQNRVTISRNIGQRWRLIGWGGILEK